MLDLVNRIDLSGTRTSVDALTGGIVNIPELRSLIGVYIRKPAGDNFNLTGLLGWDAEYWGYVELR
jgi:hypothetical protein